MAANIRQATIAARVYLEMRGYDIIEQNWHRSRSKIDIICRKHDDAYFVNIVYDPNEFSVSPEPINETWLMRLHEAANIWVDENKWTTNYHFSSITLAGKNYTIMSFSDDIA